MDNERIQWMLGVNYVPKKTICQIYLLIFIRYYLERDISRIKIANKNITMLIPNEELWGKQVTE